MSDGEWLASSEEARQAVTDAIKGTKLWLLVLAGMFVQKEMRNHLVATLKIDEFQTLLAHHERSTTPTLDELDRLMRYQTTLSRQLSTATGELLKLNELAREI